MIVKILSSSSNSFYGVKYNDTKIENGTGELITMKNFPSHINQYSSQDQVRDYFKSTAAKSRTLKPQFHAVISTKYREHSRDQLDQIGQAFMSEIGYGDQPYIIVFHNDSDNNHIHIVSSRVDKKTGKKINDSFERVKAHQALRSVLIQLGIQDTEQEKIREVEKLFNYNYNSISQFQTLLERNGYQLVSDNQHTFKIVRSGLTEMKVSKGSLNFSKPRNDQRKKQLRAILHKYKEDYSTIAFKVIDNRDVKTWDKKKESKIKIEWNSEFQERLKKQFGIDIVFHQKDSKTPFGYTLIDNKDKTIWKGSEIARMNDLFTFSADQIDKKTYELLKNYNINSLKEKALLREFYGKRLSIEISNQMLWVNNAKKSKTSRDEVVSDTLKYLKNKNSTEHVHILLDNRTPYVIHTGQHFIGSLESLLGQKTLQTYSRRPRQSNLKNSLLEILSEMTDLFLDEPYTAADPAEKELRKKRKKKSRKRK